MGGKNFAWVVPLPNEELLEKALLSGEMLRRTKSSAPVLALVAKSALKSKSFSKLDSVFEAIFVADSDPGSESDVSTYLLLNLLKMTIFSKIVVLQPGVLILEQSDHLFDTGNRPGLILTNEEGDNWSVLGLVPCLKKHKVAVKCLAEEYNWQQLCATIFGKTWKNAVAGRVIRFQGHKQEKIVEIQRSWNGNHSEIIENLAEATMLKGPGIPKEDTKTWVAVVGMSCRFPEANSLDEYWDLLKNGKNTSRSLPEHRMKLIQSEKLDSQMKGNFLKCPIDQFDASFFGMSPNEACLSDPQTRLLLEVSWEAFENAGLNPDKLRASRTGVFYGSWVQEYKEALNNESSPPEDDYVRKYLANAFGSTASKLSFFYGFTGPNVATESGCSSSMVAVDLACKSLQRRECPLALAAGANILVHLNMKQKVIWSEDAICRTFDANPTGYGRSEGVAVLVLKRYSDALRDQDRIHGIIRGTWTSQEGLSRSFGTPTTESEAEAMRGALSEAKVDPSEVSYLEAHATGTSVGDPIEASAIVQAYTSNIIREKPLIIGSGKTNIGHCESTSGMAGIIKVLLAMRHEMIPPHINMKSLNPLVDFSKIPGTIPTGSLEWRRHPERPRIAGVSSFGITGTDVHLILQEPPEPVTNSEAPVDDSMPQIMSWSAKSEAALVELTNSYVKYLEMNPKVAVSNIAYNINSCRAHHAYRRAIVVPRGIAGDLLRQVKNGPHFSGKAKTQKPKFCFTFPPGRTGGVNWEPARILYNMNSFFKSTLDEANSIFKSLSGTSILPIFLHGTHTTQAVELKCVEWFACTLSVQYALVKLLESYGIHPDCVIGHCLGEVVAAVVSGTLTLENGFRVIMASRHFALSQKTNPAEMMAITADREDTLRLITEFQMVHKGKWVDGSNFNCSTQTVVSAEPETISKFQIFLQGKGIKCKALGIDVSGHSRVIEDAYLSSMQDFSKVQHRPSKIPYISSSTGRITENSHLSPDYWYKCWRNCVQYISSCQTADEQVKADIYLEISVEPTLTKFTEENLKNSKGLPVSLFLFHNKGEDGLTGMFTTLAHLYTLGCDINWDKFNRLQGHQRRILDLPHYPFQRKSFWFERKNIVELKKNSMVKSDIENLHPLLGGPLPNALEETIFQSLISKKTAEYIYDHLVGSEVIFPGAGFLEMILAAGYYDLKPKDNENLLAVENFQVKSALHLTPSTDKQLQTIFHSDDSDRLHSNFSVYASDHGKWQEHACGEFMLCHDDDMVLRDLSEVLNRSSETTKDYAAEYYKRFAEVGLNFGPHFQSIKKVYKGLHEILVEVKIPDDSQNFICHPILIDSMIQTFILHTKPELKKLHVPIKIGNFQCRPMLNMNQNSGRAYVYCKTEPSGLTKTITLLNKNGTVLASMINLELAPTSVEAILSTAISQNSYSKKDSEETLEIYKTVWKPCQEFDTSGSFKISKETEADLMLSKIFQNLLNELEGRNRFTTEEKFLDDGMNRLCYLYVIKCLYDLGWSPEVRRVYDVNAMETKLGIKSSLTAAFRHFLTFIVDNGDFAVVGKGQYKVQKELLSNAQVLEEIDNITSNPIMKSYRCLDVVLACSPKLAEILKGNVKASKIVFGTEINGKNWAEIYYEFTRFHEGAFEHPARVFAQIVNHVWTDSPANGQNKVIRILEVGGGTGTFTMRALPKLEAIGVKYQYYFTDISPSFFSKAMGKFDKYSKNMTFKVLDIGTDPLRQGFPPAYFDIVVGVDVIHATTHLRTTLKNLEMITKDGGRILMGETNRPIREVDISLGLLEGYWIFDDDDVRDRGHCTIPKEKWIELLRESGYTKELCAISSCEDQLSVISARLDRNHLREWDVMTEASEWVIFHDGIEKELLETFRRKLEMASRKVNFLSMNNISEHGNLQMYINRILEDKKENLEGILFWLSGFSESDPQLQCQSILEPLLYTSKFLQKAKLTKPIKLHLATTGSWVTGEETEDDFTVNPVFASLWGYMRTLRVEMKEVKSKSIDFATGMSNDKISENLAREMWLTENQFENEIFYREDMRLVRRLRNEQSDEKITPISEERFCIELPGTKIMSDLRYGKDYKRELGENQVEVEIRCASLNFRDVFSVIKPTKYFEQFKTIGLDYAGVISRIGINVSDWNVGDEVFGCNWDEGTIKSHLVTGREDVMKMEDSMTFAEAATLPAVFFTAWHCMKNVADLRPGQTILVHAATGGVGLVAIQIAKLLGVNVIGTAGNSRKRQFLRSLGLQHVYSSRSLEFAEKIKQVTNGNGVDMVLNCLTGPGFKEASLEVCRVGGNFIEISKLDIWQPHEVYERKPGVNYEVVDIVKVPVPILQDMMEKLSSFLRDGKIKPLDSNRFAATNIVGALTYLQKAKHIGKVIVEMPRYDITSGEMKQYLFNEKSTYLITGGRGSIGLSVAKWMVSQGARYLVLVGRSPPEQKILQWVEEMELSGCRVVNAICDIADYNQCKKLIEKVKSQSLGLPPLKGIHHCSGVRSDKLIGNQDWESFEYPLKVKVKGTYNLHVLTRDEPLDFFCLYSSLASTFGNFGQSNYTAANCYLDSFAQMRHSMGMPALSINLGHWKGGIAENVVIPWLIPFSSEVGVSSLQRIFQTKIHSSPLISAGHLNWNGLIKMTPYFEKTLLESVERPQAMEYKRDDAAYRTHPKLKTKKSLEPQTKKPASSKKTMLETYTNLGEEKGRRDLIRTHVIRTVCDTLGMREDEVEDDDLDFSIMGMDSLMSIEFTNKLLSPFDSNFGFIDVEENGTVRKMTELLISIIDSQISS